MRRHLVSQIVKWVFSLLSFVLAAIGLGGIPDATTQWADWIQDLQRITTPDILRTALVAFGVAILLSVHGGPRLVQFAFSKLFRKENGQPFRVCYRVFNDLVRLLNVLGVGRQGNTFSPCGGLGRGRRGLATGFFTDLDLVLNGLVLDPELVVSRDFHDVC